MTHTNDHNEHKDSSNELIQNSEKHICTKKISL